MAKWHRKIWEAPGKGWRVAGNLSTLQWILGPWWVQILGAVAMITTVIIGILKSQPVLWIAAALWVLLAVLLISAIVRIKPWLPRETRPITIPRKNWIPLHKAPFQIGVTSAFDDVAKHPAWQMDLALVDSVNGKPKHPKMIVNSAVPAYRNKLGGDLIYGKVEWEDQSFGWLWGEFGKSVLGFSVFPWDLETSSNWIWSIDVDVWDKLRPKANFAWRLMLDVLSGLIDGGHFHVWARCDNPSSPFTCVTSDVWRHFKVTDWHRGQAECDGQKLYSVHVEPRLKV
jgi:hypothetical protein